MTRSSDDVKRSLKILFYDYFDYSLMHEAIASWFDASGNTSIVIH